MKPLPLRAPKSFPEFSPAEWLDYVKSLRTKTNENDSLTVPGVRVSLGKRTVISITREEKYVTRNEIAFLATEKNCDEIELLIQFRKRKIEVQYDDGDSRFLSDECECAARAPKKNARDKKASKSRKRKATDNSEHQLLEPRCDSDVQAQS